MTTIPLVEYYGSCHGSLHQYLLLVGSISIGSSPLHRAYRYVRCVQHEFCLKPVFWKWHGVGHKPEGFSHESHKNWSTKLFRNINKLFRNQNTKIQSKLQNVLTTQEIKGFHHSCHVVLARVVIVVCSFGWMWFVGFWWEFIVRAGRHLT